MPKISHSDLFAKFKTQAYNSSHFVCLLADLTHFESQNGFVFSYTTRAGVTLLALEPIWSSLDQPWDNYRREAFKVAWAEFCSEIKPEVAAFVAVYSPFVEVLRCEGFQSMKIGHEPWMDLDDCIPTGNAGKGVRSARNQALHSGVVVEEWRGGELDETRSETILKLFSQWKDSRAVDLGGFLNASDPLAYRESRRYFVASTKTGTQCGYLVATPIAVRNGYFLEDLILSRDAPRGTGELLTLEALVRLRDSGFKTASLGVVSVLNIDSKSADQYRVPKPIGYLTIQLKKWLSKVYNFGGLETFRKRFKPKRWESIHLAIKDLRSNDATGSDAWMQTFFALLLAFKPRFRFSLTGCLRSLMETLGKYSVTLIVAGVSMTLFATINHFGSLPQWALDDFGFSASAPFREWILRSVVSDYLYFNRSHFVLWGVSYFLILAWAERKHKTKFLLPFVATVSILDDLVNYACVIAPFEYLQPMLFKSLVSHKDVGGSLGLVTMIGFQLCQFRKNREILFSFLSLGIVFGFVFEALQFQQLVLNLNHFLFLTIGFICGKLKFEWHRRQCRKAAKGKPPVSVTVVDSKKKSSTPLSGVSDEKDAA